MSRRARWMIGCVVLIVVVVVGCVALADFALGYSRWKNCWFPPRDPDIEIVVSACREPNLYSVSPDGKYMLFTIRDREGNSHAQLLNLVTEEERTAFGIGQCWLNDRLFLVGGIGRDVPQFWVADVTDESLTPLQWVQGLPDTTSRREDGTLVFSSEVVEWFRDAEVVYYFPDWEWAVALSPDFKGHPENNYVLATPRASRGGDREAIRALLVDNGIAYTEIVVWKDPHLRSHDGQFTFVGAAPLVGIVDSAGTELVNYEYRAGGLDVGQPSSRASGWAYDDSGVYFQMGRGGGGLCLFSPPGPIQPILKLKVPEAYLQPTATPAP